jgi:hypothetical protein
MSLLTILIPTISSRVDLLNMLVSELEKQINTVGLPIKIDILHDYQNISIGGRRNILLNRCESEYVCFFDDDDLPTDSYIENLAIGMLLNYDCCSLKGIYTVNGLNAEIFEHSLKYTKWSTNNNSIYPNVKYERPPNHLNCIKSVIAKQFFFEEINHGEDKIWSDNIQSSGMIKTEYYINEPIYKYLKRTQ